MSINYAKEWREFKKLFPKFTKHKKFKGDVGPNMEKIAKLEAKRAKLSKTQTLIVGAIYKVSKATLAAMEDYESLLQESEIGDETVQAEAEDKMEDLVNRVQSWTSNYEEQFKQMSKHQEMLKATAESWDD